MKNEMEKAHIELGLKAVRGIVLYTEMHISNEPFSFLLLMIFLCFKFF